MRTFNVTMMGIGTLTFVVLGGLGLAGALYPAAFLTIGDLIAGPVVYAMEGVAGRIISLLAGIVLLLTPVYFIWGNIKAARRERTVVLNNPMGEVLVSLPAIEDFARVLKGKIEGLRDIKGRVVFGRKGLRVSARITLFSDVSIASVTQEVQEGIRHYVQNTLGIEQEINPTVVVTKVVNREKPGGTPGLKTSKPAFTPPANEIRLR